MAALPSPDSEEVPSPGVGRQRRAASPSSGSSPYWASASSASPGTDAVPTRRTIHETTGPYTTAAFPSNPPRQAAAPAVRATVNRSLEDDASTTSTACEDQWASPAEVLELQAVCRQLAQRYEFELHRLHDELARAERDRDAYRRAAENTAPLQKAYTASKSAYEANKKAVRDWEEERELMRLQLQKLSIENEKLRLSLTKQKGLVATGLASLIGTDARTLRLGSGSSAAVTMDQSPWSGVAPVLSPAFRPSVAADTKRVSSGGKRTGVSAAVRRESAGATLIAPHLRDRSTQLTPGSSNDSKLGDVGAGRISASASGSLFVDTPPRASAPVPAAEEASLTTPTVSNSFPSADGPATDRPAESSGDTKRAPSRHALASMLPETLTGHTTDADRTASPPPAPGLAGANAQENTMLPVPSEADDDRDGVGAVARHSTQPHETGSEASRGEDQPFAPMGESGHPHSSSQSALLTPSSSNDNADRRSASTNPVYAQGVSSASATSTTSYLRHHEDEDETVPRGGRGAGLFTGPQTSPAGGFTFRTDDGGGMATAHAHEFSKPRGPSSASAINTNSAGSTLSSAVSSGLSLLYRLPRGPAEALEEQLRLVESLNQLAQRNAELEARAQHVEAMWGLTASQRDQRLLATTHERERARREAQHWADAAASLETRAASLDAQLEDSRAAFESIQQELLETHDAMHALKAAHEAEKESLRQSLEDAHNTVQQRLKQTYEETARAVEATHAAEIAEADRARHTAEARQEALLTELQQTHAALSKASHDLRAQQEAAAAHTHGAEAALQHAQDQRQAVEESLAKAIRDRAVLEAHVAELESQLAHHQAMHKTREECLETMEARLEQACQSLAANGSAEEALALWQTRAKAVESELETQRAFYERELRVRQTAMETMQHTHQQESLRLAKKLEQACTRYEALKLKFTAAARDNGWLRDITTSTNKLDGKHKKATRGSTREEGQPDRDAPRAGSADDEDTTEMGEVPNADRVSLSHANARERSAPCDPVKLLLASNATAAQLCRALHRAAV